MVNSKSYLSCEVNAAVETDIQGKKTIRDGGIEELQNTVATEREVGVKTGG